MNTIAGYAQNQLGVNAVSEPQKMTPVQMSFALMEDEAKKLRAVVEHLSSRLDSIMSPPCPAAGQAGQSTKPISCQFSGLMEAQAEHVSISRSILENILDRIQL